MICDVLFTLQIHVLHKENKPFDQDDGDNDKIRFFFSAECQINSNWRYTEKYVVWYIKKLKNKWYKLQYLEGKPLQP